MPNFASSALRLLRSILGSPSPDKAPYAGTATPLDGNTAVAITEASISEGAGLGASFPSDTSELAWRAEQGRRAASAATDDLWSHGAGGPRGVLATTIGLSLSGVRATGFLSSVDLASAPDLLAGAAGRHLPLVIHLGNRALPGHAAAIGSGHEACHSIADSGCFMLFAANTQEAVDFTLVARRVAEQVLVPGVVIMDGEQTALAVQDVRLPGIDLTTRFVGASGDRIPCPTTAQKLLFGETRRRLPRWHDLDRPVLLGGLQSTASWGLGRAADQIFLAQHLVSELNAAFKLFSDLTGRQHHAFSDHQLEDASLVMVVQGAAIETAEAVAVHLKSTHGIKVGVLGLRTLRPFPGARLAEALSGKKRVLVLERTNSPTADAPPLFRELQAALRQTIGAASHPVLQSVIYGLGGLPLRGADLIELCTGKDGRGSHQVFLGVPFARTASPYPKRQVVLDLLRREYPGIAENGLTSESVTPDLRPAEALTLAIHHISGQTGAGLATEAAALLQVVSQAQLRSRPDLSPEPWGNYCVDRFTCAPAELRDPGDQMPIDLLVLLAEARPTQANALTDLQQKGLLLLEDAGAGGELPGGLVTALRRSEFVLYRVATFEAAQNNPNSPHAREDYILGAIFGVLLESDQFDLKPRRLLSVREQLLMHLPERERAVRMGHFQEGMNRVHRLDRGTLRSGPAPAEVIEEEAPRIVRELHNTEETYDSLPRFWDQVGVLYRNAESSQLSPDPYLATGAIPPLTAAFRDLSPLRQTLPSLDPTLCDGCGNCWRACPDGAFGAIAQTPAQILDTAIGQVGANALRPLASKLAARMSSQCKDGKAQDFGKLLIDATEWLQQKISLPKARRESLLSAVGKVRQAVGDLPLVATLPFFSETVTSARELLLLAIDPNACKGCGICISACKPGALTAVTQTQKNLRKARAVRNAWDRLPDTPVAVCDRIGADPRIGRLAAVLLSRASNNCLTGGDAAEPGSGERLALRLVMAFIESRQRPLTEAFIGEIRAAKERISERIREMLTDALPADDLDALAQGLDKLETKHADLGDFIATAETSIDSGIDAPHLRRLVHLAKGLTDLASHLSGGTQGLGRAHLGMVLSGGPVSRWAGVFPNNPFAMPVVLDPTRDSAPLAIGLLEGQLRQSTEGLLLMRRARLELESPDQAGHNASASTHLGWRELTDEERAICPALLVICGDDLLRGGGLSQLDSLLSSGLPIKLMVLTELDLGLTTRTGADLPLAASADPGLDLALLALARRQACIAQTSIAHPEHLARCLDTALATPGPALLHLYAPSPLRHGFSAKDTLARASLAVESRLFPLFLFDPQAEGVFGSRLSLDGNPQPLASWPQTNAADLPTPASWALGEQRFYRFFAEISGEDPAAVPVSDYLALDDSARTDRIPVVQAAGEASETRRYRIAPELIRVCAERQRAWRVLQEIAGLVTPFTARVERIARDQVAADQEAALAALREDYEARIAALQGEMLENTRKQMRRRMMQLAGYAPAADTRPGGSAK